MPEDDVGRKEDGAFGGGDDGHQAGPGGGYEGEPPPAASPLGQYGLVEKDAAIYREKKDSLDLVCNFALRIVTAGQARYLGGRTMPLHEVMVERAGGKCEFWTIHGSLFEPGNWVRASREQAVIADRRKFAAYVHQRIDIDGVPSEDPGLDVVYAVGIFRGRDGRFRISDGVEFPDGHEECQYHGVRFARSGDKAVFARMAALRTDPAAKTLLVWLLGGSLKEALGGSYPHCQAKADTTSGKTTFLGAVCARLGIKMVDGPEELATAYRTKKLLANSTVPIVIDEVGRLASDNAKRVANTLNSAYGILPTSHGPRGRQYTLATPLLMAGQDCNMRDEALLTKIVVYKMDAEGKNPQALDELRRCADVFPTGDWLEFAAQYANDHDLAAACRAKEQLLRARLPAGIGGDRAEFDR